MSVNDFMKDGGKVLKANIVKKLNGSNYIGGDISRLVHLKHASENFGELQEGQSYSFIKPQKENEITVALSPKFKPAKIGHIKAKSTAEDLAEIEKNIQVGRENICCETFETCEQKPGKSIIAKMTVKCLSLSRIIQTSYGEYRIAKVRDTDNSKGDINLYKHCKNKMIVDKIYHMETVKITDYKNEETKYRRLATTPTTLIKEVSRVEESRYSHMTLGDERTNGICIGIGRVFGYHGCSNCWKKVDESDANCKNCNLSTDSKNAEFSAELYIEIEEMIVTIQGFKRMFPPDKRNTIDEEEITSLLEGTLVGKKIDFEYNEGKNEDEWKLVKIRHLSD